MDLTIKKQELLGVLSAVGKVGRKSTVAVISEAVLVEADEGGIHFTATDLGSWARIRAEGEVLSSGTEVVPLKALQRAAKAAETSDLQLTTTDRWVLMVRELTDGLSSEEGLTIRIQCPVDPDEYPRMVDAKSDPVTTLDFAGLCRALRQTAHCLSNEGTYYDTDTHCLVTGEGTLEVVTTDGHRLSMGSVPVLSYDPEEYPDKYMGIPMELAQAAIAVSKISEITTVQLHIQKDQTHLIGDGVHLAVVGRGSVDQFRFPNYRLVLPDGDPVTEVSVPRKDLEKALKRILSLHGSKKVSIVLTASNDGLLVECKAEEIGEISLTVPASIRSGGGVIGIYQIGYLLDSLKELRGREIRIRHYEPDGEIPKPLEILSPGDPNFTCDLIIPISPPSEG